MRKHFPDIPRPNADTDTEPDTDAYTDADADTNAHADADTHAVAWADERHDNGATEPSDADKLARGGLRRGHAQPVGMGAGPRKQGIELCDVQSAHQFLQRLAGQRPDAVGDAVARREDHAPDTVVQRAERQPHVPDRLGHDVRNEAYRTHGGVARVAAPLGRHRLPAITRAAARDGWKFFCTAATAE